MGLFMCYGLCDSLSSSCSQLLDLFDYQILSCPLLPKSWDLALLAVHIKIFNVLRNFGNPPKWGKVFPKFI